MQINQNIYTPVRSIIPLTDNVPDLGSSTKGFKDGYLRGNLIFNPPASPDLAAPGVIKFNYLYEGTLYPLTIGSVVGEGDARIYLKNFSGTEEVKFYLDWDGSGGATWIDMPTLGSSGIGSGGYGNNAWIAYAGGDTAWFADALTGDICYRNSGHNLLLGIERTAGSQIKLSSAGIGVNDNIIPGTTNLFNIGGISNYLASLFSNKLYIGGYTATNNTEIRKSDSFSAVWQYVPTNWTNDTTEAKISYGTAFSYSFASTGSYHYIGSDTPISEIYFHIAIAATTSMTLAWTYWNGSVWLAFTPTVDGTSAFTTSGSVTNSISASQVKATITQTLASGYATAPDQTSRYWIRVRRSSGTASTPTFNLIVPNTNQPFAFYANAGDTSALIYANVNGDLYIPKIYLNSAANLDGTTAGQITSTGNIIPAVDSTNDLGSATKVFSNYYATNFRSYYGHLYFNQVPNPTTYPACALAGVAGNVTVGEHKYLVVFVTALGQTSFTGTSPNAVTTVAGNQQVNLTDIPVSTNSNVTARKIYRTKIAGVPLFYLLTTINDNTTTTYTDNIADGSLSATDVINYFYSENTTSGILYNGTSKFAFSGVSNTFFGTGAGQALTSGYQNNLFGYQAGYSLTSGLATIAIGYQAGYAMTTTGETIAIGTKALLNATGVGNTAIGDQCGRTITTGTYNTFIGWGAGYNASQVNSVTNSTAIGLQAYTTKDNQVVLGNSNVVETLLRGNVGVGGTAPAFKLEVTPATGYDGVQIARYGDGTANGAFWRFGIKNSGNTDTLLFGQSSTTYTTGGTVGWIGNSEAFLYYPSGAYFRIGCGTGATSMMSFASTSGNVGVYTNTPTERMHITGNLFIDTDSNKLILGAGKDMSVYYDGTNGYIKTSEVAASDLHITTGTAKTVVLDTPVYDDFNTAVATGKVPAANYPAWSAFVGNLYQYTFAVDDYIYLEATEFLHGWKEGTELELHVHWATGGLNDATVRGVKWEIEYAWANMQAAGGQIVFAGSSGSTETSIAANEAAYTHKYTSVLSFTPSGGKIGGQLVLRLKRIASVTNTAPANNPYCLSVGIHHQKDTIGSRASSTK